MRTVLPPEKLFSMSHGAWRTSRKQLDGEDAYAVQVTYRGEIVGDKTSLGVTLLYGNSGLNGVLYGNSGIAELEISMFGSKDI